MMFEAELAGLDLDGPRTALWWMQACARAGGTALTRRRRWASESGIPKGDRSIHEHQVLSRALDYASKCDSLNVANLASMEIVLRRLQLIESAHLEDPTAPNYEGGDLFLEHGDRPGGALDAPILRTHVATKLRDEAAVAKERRKAREERPLGRGGGQGRGGGGGADRGGRGRGPNAAAEP